MALSVILILYFSIGLLAAAGSIFISQKLFAQRRRRPRGDALLIEKSEAASALIYWNGKRYVWFERDD